MNQFINSILGDAIGRAITPGDLYNVTLERGINPLGMYELNLSQSVGGADDDWIETYYYDNAEDREHDADLLEHYISINYV